MKNNLSITVDLGTSTIETEVATDAELKGAINATGINDISVSDVDDLVYWKALLDALKKDDGTLTDAQKALLDTTGKISSITITGDILLPYGGGSGGITHPNYSGQNSGVTVQYNRDGTSISGASQKTYYGVSALLVNQAKSNAYKPSISITSGKYLRVNDISTAAQAAVAKKDTDINRINTASNVNSVTYFQDLLEFCKDLLILAQPTGNRDFGTGITLTGDIGSEASDGLGDTQANSKNLIAATTVDKTTAATTNATGTILTLNSVTDLAAGMSVNGANIPSGTNITAITDLLVGAKTEL